MLKEALKLPSIGKNWLLSMPFYVSFDVTNYCNLRCEGCDFPLLLGQKQIQNDKDAEGIEARIEKLNNAFGSMVMVIAGFEPTIRKDLAEIIRYSSQHNFVGMVTNGTLITPEKARKYWDAGLAFASVSLPALNEDRFRKITGTKKYGVDDVKGAIETLVETAPKAFWHRVAQALGIKIPEAIITVTIDNSSTPKELGEMAAYAESVGASVSFQPYSASKPASAASGYLVQNDKRVITIDTLNKVFNGSIAGTIERVRRAHPVIIGRKSALKNFDIFVSKGKIPFKPRALKVYTNGDISLHPEAQAFSNIDSKTPEEVWQDYRGHVEQLRQTGGFFAPNAYRCVNLTNPSTPLGDIVGGLARSFSKSI